MIILWRTDRIGADDFKYLSECWKLFAEKAHEEVVVAAWNVDNVYKAWDAVNRTSGRYIIWTKPEFIPHVSMWSELDYLRAQGVLVVSQKKYKCAFTKGWDNPVMWEPDGIDGVLTVFQLAGQTKVTLPPGYALDIWAWIAEEKMCSYQVPQRYSGGVSRKVWAARSILGETVYSPFTRSSKELPFTQESQYTAWHERMDAWCSWLKTVQEI